ncbi:32882_t:CDS:2, partial [Racocetra persica]
SSKERKKHNWINSSRIKPTCGGASLPFPINPLLNPEYRNKNMLKKPIKKTPNQELKQAYDLVIKDLFANLKKAKDGAKIKLVVAATCVGLYFYGSQVKNNEYLKLLPVQNNQQQANSSTQNQTNYQQPPQQSQPQQPSIIMKLVASCLPVLLEQFAGPMVPSMGGQAAENQLVMSQVLSLLQQINQRLTILENSATQQFTALNQQVQSIKSVRLTHQKETKAIDYNLQNEQQ